MRKWYKPGAGNKRLKTADKWFSRRIRLKGTDADGFGRCITCQKVKQFSDLDCGHYKTRNNISTRFDAMNAHVQCRNCNSFRGGEAQMHGMMIATMHGQAALDRLEYKSRSIMKLLPFEIKEISDENRIETKKLWEMKSDQFKEDHKNLMK